VVFMIIEQIVEVNEISQSRSSITALPYFQNSGFASCDRDTPKPYRSGSCLADPHLAWTSHLDIMSTGATESFPESSLSRLISALVPFQAATDLCHLLTKFLH
jgi:hypothetical protein